MSLRDEAERALHAWNAHEVNRGAKPVIDYDCHPVHEEIEASSGRLPAYRAITDLRRRAAESGQDDLASRLGADLAYLAALMGQRAPLTDYVQATQGCPANGWPAGYVGERGDVARAALAELGLPWGPDLASGLRELCGPMDAAGAADAIRHAAAEYEPAVRRATGSDAPYDLSIETTDVDEYWSYWLDGAGPNVRLRLNLRGAVFTHVDARQFALHEVLGHGLQNASYAARSATEDVPWVRMTSVHALHQVLLEGLAQAMPLFVAPDDKILTARVRLVHYTQLVRAELHLMVNSGTSVVECADHARKRVPWWKDATIGNFLADRGANPRLRSYLWAYPAGIDWFSALAEADTALIERVLHTAYRQPLSPADLAALWPDGPPIGGPSGHR